jgi:hypothetical protein
MNAGLGNLAAFWSPKTSIFTKLGVVVQFAYILSSLAVMTILLREIEFINWWWVGVLILVVLSIVLSFSGKKNLGFVIASASFVVHLIQASVNESMTIFTVDWGTLLYIELLLIDYFFLASLIFLPLAIILLIVGRPEWKLIKGNA